MKELKRKLVLSVLAVLSLFVIVGNGWSQVIGLPQAGFNGYVQTFLDNGTGDDLVFLITTVTSVVYSDGNLGTADSIIGSTVSLTGAKRDPIALPGTTFTPATISISDGVTTYFTATLRDTVTNNIEFELIDGLWRLNPDLDINNLPTLNLENILLYEGPIPSNYILDLQNKLGGQSIAGMTMTLSVFPGGDFMGDSFSQILEGIIDGVPAVAPNTPPEANAGATTSNTTCLSTSCEITLDGSQSSDPDSGDSITEYAWYLDADEDGIPAPLELISVVLPQENPGPSPTLTVDLPLGIHQIILVVTDSNGAPSDPSVDPYAIITVVIDPAELSFIEIDKAQVKRDGKVKIKGRLALPAGVSHVNVNSVGRAILGLRTLDNVDVIAIDESVDFIEHSNGNKWKYSASPALGIKKFSIDWDGSKFSYFSLMHDLYIKTDHIGENETELEIRTCAAVTIDINGTQIIIDENNDVSCPNAGVKIDGDDDGDSDDSDSDGGSPSDDDGDCTIGVTLPFALTPDMDIIVTGAINETIPVASGYTAAVGKFKLHGRFDAAAIDFTSLTPWLETTITLGDEGFSGTLIIDEATWTKIKPKSWKYKSN